MEGLAEGNRSQDGTRMELTNRGDDMKGGDPARAEKTKTQGDTEGLEGQGGAAGMCDQGGDGGGMMDRNRREGGAQQSQKVGG